MTRAHLSVEAEAAQVVHLARLHSSKHRLAFPPEQGNRSSGPSRQGSSPAGRSSRPPSTPRWQEEMADSIISPNPPAEWCRKSSQLLEMRSSWSKKSASTAAAQIRDMRQAAGREKLGSMFQKMWCRSASDLRKMIALKRTDGGIVEESSSQCWSKVFPRREHSQLEREEK